MSTNSLRPVFCFISLQKKYGINDCQQASRAHLLDLVASLSQLTWGDIQRQPRTTNGHEMIPVEQIKVGIPDVVSLHGDKVLSFRFNGSAHRLIGFRTDQVFHAIWIDTNLTVYDH